MFKGLCAVCCCFAIATYINSMNLLIFRVCYGFRFFFLFWLLMVYIHHLMHIPCDFCEYIIYVSVCLELRFLFAFVPLHSCSECCVISRIEITPEWTFDLLRLEMKWHSTNQEQTQHIRYSV